MATIKTALRITYTPTSGGSVVGDLATTVTQVGNGAYFNIQTIGAASEAVTFGDVTGDVLLFFKNDTPLWDDLSAAEQAAEVDEATYNDAYTVYVGTTNPATSSSINTHKLKPGKGVFKDGPLENHYAIRDTNDVQLVVLAIEL
jgi:hypothetical protein